MADSEDGPAAAAGENEEEEDQPRRGGGRRGRGRGGSEDDEEEEDQPRRGGGRVAARRQLGMVSCNVGRRLQERSPGRRRHNPQLQLPFAPLPVALTVWLLRSVRIATNMGTETARSA